MRSFTRLFTQVTFVSLLAMRAALALDKQGSAHGGEVGGDDTGFNVSGGLTYGVSLVNSSYAARPDNTGLALFRYASHVDVDFLGRKLSMPLDLNLFTDRQRKGAAVFSPTELDIIGGLTTTNPIGPGDLELGSRIEHDRPVDRGGFTQTYVDVRARYLYSLKALWPGLADALIGGDITGHGTLGWFAYNPTYAARPDNTGLALLRYALRSELSVWHDYLSIGLDGTFFTDRRAANVIRPTELDLTPELIGHVGAFELHLAYERDMPLDKGSFTQAFLYALFVYNFDVKRTKAEPFAPRGSILSP